MTTITLPRRVLPDMTKPSAEQLEIAALRAENERLRAAQPKPRALSWKVSEKGAISVYGLGRFPVTLYVEQFDKLVAVMPELSAWVEANRGQFKTKG